MLATLVDIYKSLEHWTVFAGYSEVFENNENVAKVKTDIEYGIPLSKNFDVRFGVEHDVKIEGNASWLMSIGIS